jgi:hypothetical protein
VHTGHYGTPTLDILGRQATFVWDRLGHHNVDPVPPWSAADGVEWERLGKVRRALPSWLPCLDSVCFRLISRSLGGPSQYFREHRRFDLAEYLAS